MSNDDNFNDGFSFFVGASVVIGAISIAFIQSIKLGNLETKHQDALQASRNKDIEIKRLQR